ncbi:MAG: GNAT family N-acetyltransferase [Nevskia sp.]|jgi:RimJ/RimL family protein N-acetyltransferase|nr:GNAT family N-acetyltransferase [Nevskia sp.]MCK9385164.1 GNAT family N-acetyltransferase [Nevskia sp.]
MNLVAITQELTSRQEIQSSDFLKDLCVSTIAMYPNGIPMLPWAGYLGEEQGVFIGTCAFKALPEFGEVEIAYFTFPEHEGRGVATLMAQSLIDLAKQYGVVMIKAQTLPEKNVSTHILEKLGFKFSGSVIQPTDGQVWEWHRSGAA